MSALLLYSYHTFYMYTTCCECITGANVLVCGKKIAIHFLMIFSYDFLVQTSELLLRKTALRDVEPFVDGTTGGAKETKIKKHDFIPLNDGNLYLSLPSRNDLIC